MSIYKHKPLDDITNLRLITLLPGTPGTNISINLQESIFDKNDPPTYEALSYVWGSENDPEPIHVDDEGTVFVTRNLSSALQHLRHKEKTRTLWVDALAIDQSNNKEKSAQVAMMGEIYRLASRVVAWLGPEESDSDRSLKVMARIGSQVRMDWGTKLLKPAPGCTDTSVADTTKELDLSSEDVSALSHLLSRQWFERLWIRQEVILANPQAVVQCGHQQVLWTNFRGALVCLYIKSGLQRHMSRELSERLEFLRGFILQKENVSLWDLREEFGKAKCQDPRDRIYAISSMLYEGEKPVCPQPDYGMPVRGVYRDVVLRWLSIFSGLDLLRECELYDNAPGPSWVPDWSRGATGSLRALPLMACSNLGGWYETPEPGVLRVAGICGSVVTEVHDIPHEPNRRLENIYRWAHELLATQILDGQYVSGCSLIEAYARTLVCDGIADEKDPAGHVWPNLETAKLATVHIQSEPQFSTHEFRNGSPGSLFLRCVMLTRGKKFIKCDNGYIGIAPPLTKPGDQVCVLLGCKTPMVLRPTKDGNFTLVGESFVHGLSKGEALLGPLPKNIRVSKVFQNAQVGYAVGFVNGLSDTVSFVDPRLEALSLDLEEFRSRSNQNGNAFLFLEPEVLQKHGVNIKLFDLR